MASSARSWSDKHMTSRRCWHWHQVEWLSRIHHRPANDIEQRSPCNASSLTVRHRSSSLARPLLGHRRTPVRLGFCSLPGRPHSPPTPHGCPKFSPRIRRSLGRICPTPGSVLLASTSALSVSSIRACGSSLDPYSPSGGFDTSRLLVSLHQSGILPHSLVLAVASDSSLHHVWHHSQSLSSVKIGI